MNGDRDGAGLSLTTLHARLTTAFVGRQLFLLTLIGFLFFVVLFFFDYFQYDWDKMWSFGNLDLKYLPPLPLIVVLVFGFVYFFGILFTLVPSERSFQFFFNGMLAGLFVLNYDHSVIDWLVLSLGVAARPLDFNPVSAFKIASACALLSAVIVMHYNILSDDFTRRMVRRGIPTEEAARIRPGMTKALLPLLFACSVVAVALAVVGEFSALVFATHGLFPKGQILILGILGLAIGFVLRSIIKELYSEGGTDEDDLGVKSEAESIDVPDASESPND